MPYRQHGPSDLIPGLHIFQIYGRRKGDALDDLLVLTFIFARGGERGGGGREMLQMF